MLLNSYYAVEDLLRIYTRTVTDYSTGCWVWQGWKVQGGYGRIMFKGKALLVHRLTYAICKGNIPEGLEIDHLCRNRACCNPAHLEAVTHYENCRRGRACLTHCPYGHEYTPDNTYVNQGRRNCRTCRKLRRKPNGGNHQ